MLSESRLKLLIAVILLLITGVSCAYALTATEEKLYRQVAPAVVFIYGTDDQSAASGTGTIIREDGYILTNAQVLRSPVTRKLHDKIFVFLKPDQVTGELDKDLQKQHAFPARVIAESAELDLGLVKLISLDRQITGLPKLSLAATGQLAAGTSIYALGHHSEGRLWSQTPGKIGGYAENYTNVRGWGVYQHSVPIRPGDSGGPLLADDGTLIGINTFVTRETDNPDAVPVGMNFAVSSVTARRWIAASMGDGFLPETAERTTVQGTGYLPQAAAPAKSQPDAQPPATTPTAGYLPPASVSRKDPPPSAKPPAAAPRLTTAPPAEPKAKDSGEKTAFNLPNTNTVDFDNYLARLKKSALTTLTPGVQTVPPSPAKDGPTGAEPAQQPPANDSRFNSFLEKFRDSQ